jgi:hypothetical protein
MWRFWLMAMGDGKKAGTSDISLIIRHFSSGFKAHFARPPELTKAVPSTIVPANSIWSCF